MTPGMIEGRSSADSEGALRVRLAAAYRIAHHLGWTETVRNLRPLSPTKINDFNIKNQVIKPKSYDAK